MHKPTFLEGLNPELRLQVEQYLANYKNGIRNTADTAADWHSLARREASHETKGKDVARWLVDNIHAETWADCALPRALHAKLTAENLTTLEQEIEARIAKGVSTYGERLTDETGIDFIAFSYEELLDLFLYSAGAYMRKTRGALKEADRATKTAFKARLALVMHLTGRLLNEALQDVE